MANYYQILGVESWADASEIRDAYRTLRDRYQKTDRNRYNEVMQAWSTLGDERRRRDYNRRMDLPIKPPAQAGGGDSPPRPDPSARAPRQPSSPGRPRPTYTGAATEVLSVPPAGEQETTKVHRPAGSQDTVAHAAPLPTARIVIRVQGEEDRTVDLRGAVMRIGRQPSNDIQLPDPQMFISRDHAAIIFDNGNYYIMDSGSMNGTRVQGQPLAAHQKKLLSDGDVIEIEGRLLIFQWQRVPPGARR